jgi:peroxiredoxin
MAAGAEIVAVSMDDLRGAEQSVGRFGVEYPILYTAQHSAVPESYGVFNLFGDGLASASIFLVTEGNEIAWRSIGRNYTHQVDPDDIIEQLGLLGT